MKKVRVEIPFHLGETDTDYVPNDIIVVTEEALAKIKAVNVNMVSVLGDVEPVPSADAKTERKTAVKKGKTEKTSGAKVK